jgi:hypothetical protein
MEIAKCFGTFGIGALRQHDCLSENSMPVAIGKM